MTNAQGRDFRKLLVWEKAHRLVLDAYRASASFPREEAFGLTSQLRRSAASIPANIAEGCGRGGNDLPRFCRIAVGSAAELQYHLLLARDLGMLDESDFGRLNAQANEVERMLSVFIDRLTSERRA
ncbi:MAG: four helix bundle protein [Thermomicrobiales bacterium]|nr:four helix bundle protein [Thermomicrobiales bacterium]